MTRFQFVFWWHPRNWGVGFHETGHDDLESVWLPDVYRWFLWLGPLEIRRWRT